MGPAALVNTRERKQQLGQFLTASPVADFMASLFSPLPRRVRLLDAGAGAGSLTAAFVSHCCKLKNTVDAVEATLYELDDGIVDALTTTMRECRRICDAAGIRFSFAIHSADFIQEFSACLGRGLFGAVPPVFDAAIVNPPYRKISTSSAERHALSSIGIETSNLYTGFLAIIRRLLTPGGQLVGITPRSFCNGPYFRPFREDFLNHMELRQIHVFQSRRAAFRKENVLQENVIFHAVRGASQPRQMVVSSSSGECGDEVTKMMVPFSEVVNPGDSERFIHIPSAASHSDAREQMEALNSSLESLGVTVSTGRVVDFRLKESLRKVAERGTVPLLYPCHFSGGTISWPKPHSRKPNAILDNSGTRPWLVPKGIYLLTKRFTAKEERRRLVACLFDPDLVGAEWIGIENHLNYFHEGGRGLGRNLALGLYAFLNSTVVDQYFRRFSGHTQVNATDLRSLPYPNREKLEAIGLEIARPELSQADIDQLVSEHLYVLR